MESDNTPVSRTNGDDTAPATSIEESNQTGCNASSSSANGSRTTLPQYPKYGVIGNSEPDWLDIFHSSKNLEIKAKSKQDFKRIKFDFHETYEKDLDREGNAHLKPTPIPGLSNLWHDLNAGAKTSDFYDVDPSLPLRFKNPSLLQGYGWEKEEHPLFQTTSSAYGKFPPTIHDVPHEYHGLKNTFTKHLASTGMPKNRSLNIK